MLSEDKHNSSLVQKLFFLILWKFYGKTPTPVFLPGKFHGQRSLTGYSPGVAKSRTDTGACKFRFKYQIKFSLYIPALAAKLSSTEWTV